MIRFDPVQVGEQAVRVQVGLEDEHGVQVGILFGTTEGLGLVQRRHFDEPPQPGDGLHGGSQGLPAITEVRSEGDDSSAHGERLGMPGPRKVA